MKRIFFIIKFILFISFTLFSAPPPGYYTNAYTNGQPKTGYQLKTALYNIIKNHTQQSYDSLWTHFQTTDRKPNGKVWDMYSDVPGGTPPYEYDFGTHKCGTYSKEGDCYNREHSFPASWFNNNYPMYSDLFHIYPTDGYVNNKRGNYPFGEVSNPNWTSSNGSKLGRCSFPGYDETVFEPIDEYKGDFARSYFYMVTRYENVVASWSSPMLNGTSDKCFTDWALNLLKKWHYQDPVSSKESNRNDAVYSIQSNRNPFIDHPEWVWLIWGPYNSTNTNIVLPDNPKIISKSSDVSSISLVWLSVTNAVKYKIYYDTSNLYQFETPFIYTTNYTITGLNPDTLYYIKLVSISASGNESSGTNFTIKTLPPKPLIVIFPNPAVSGDVIKFLTGSIEDCNIKIYSLSGELIKILKPDEVFDTSLNPVPPGIYFVLCEFSNKKIERKILVIKK